MLKQNDGEHLLFFFSEINCGHPGKLDNGGFKVVPDNSNFVVNTVVQYYCIAGYKLIGNVERKCQGNSSWSGSRPVCISKFYLFIFYFLKQIQLRVYSFQQTNSNLTLTYQLFHPVWLELKLKLNQTSCYFDSVGDELSSN